MDSITKEVAYDCGHTVELSLLFYKELCKIHPPEEDEACPAELCLTCIHQPLRDLVQRGQAPSSPLAWRAIQRAHLTPTLRGIVQVSLCGLSDLWAFRRDIATNELIARRLDWTEKVIRGSLGHLIRDAIEYEIGLLQARSIKALQ
ncbi:MAG TPA: hypothetical protein VNA68_02050 [Candidatus Dormibacteraeota bacterium]|nr:hypothetical protein [Candidatus Dormibacteraeota bacterium]